MDRGARGNFGIQVIGYKTPVELMIETDHFEKVCPCPVAGSKTVIP